MKRIFTFLLVSFIGQYVVIGQCDPPAAVECGMALLLCGADELDGFSCTNFSINNPTGPNPLCNGSGTPSNTQWWAFRGNGKHITITFNVDMGSCSLNKGISAGVLYECGGSNASCNSNCDMSTFSLSLTTTNCQPYYLWVDGCEGDICDYSIDVNNGESSKFEYPAPLVKLQNKTCAGGIAEVCTSDFHGSCSNYNMKWFVDGLERTSSINEYCILIEFNVGPKEVCTVFEIGDGTAICDQKISCITILPEPIKKIDEGDFFVCWEDNVDGYWWRDSIIYNSCINPPCKIIYFGENGCYTEYTKEIHLLEKQKVVPEVYKFVCDKTDLPFITEDGKLWYAERSGANIVWEDRDNHYCDTSYILHLEVFNPEINLIRSCPSCSDTVKIESKIQYDPLCSTGNIVMKGIWLNENLDTLGIGDYVILKEEDGNVFYSLSIQHTNTQTGEVTTCTIHDTSWHINIKNEPLSISGDTSICQVDTSEFSLPESYAHGCKIEWTLEDVTGNIISSAPNKMSTIKVHWPTHNTVDGKICAEIIDNCDSVRKVCFDLEGCVTTNNQYIDNQQWTVFPNPARDIIYIQGENIDKIKVEMHDLEGKKIGVQPKHDISGAISIDISEMASGIYLIQLSVGMKKEVLRFVKL